MNQQQKQQIDADLLSKLEIGNGVVDAYITQYPDGDVSIIQVLSELCIDGSQNIRSWRGADKWAIKRIIKSGLVHHCPGDRGRTTGSDEFKLYRLTK